MRPLTTSLAVIALATSFVVLPTPAGAKPKPVRPHVTRFAVPAAPPSANQGGKTNQLAANVTRTGTPFDVVGVTFDGPAPPGLLIEVRTRQENGRWSAWASLDVDESGPDRGTTEARRARSGTEPLIAPGADGVDVRVSSRAGTAPQGLTAALVEAGTSAADASAGVSGAGAAVAAVARPDIVTRAEWGADESLRTCNPTQVPPFKASVVHHTVNSNTYTAEQAPSIVRGIYAYHTTSLGWCDVGYQFLVDRFGRIYEGRVGNLAGYTQGAQAQGFNADTFGVSLIGDHTSTAPSEASLAAASAVIAWKADQARFDPKTDVTLTSAGNSKYPAGTSVTKPRVSGHRDYGYTACPGDALYSRLASIRQKASDTWASGQISWTKMVPKKGIETFQRPTGTALALTGRGYGHGRGMSQWGAYGAATQGKSWSQIAGFYYPGTTAVSQGNPPVRIWISATNPTGLQVSAQPGLVLTAGTTQVPLSSGVRWRIVPDAAGGLTLQWLNGSTWTSSSTYKAWTKNALTLSRPSYGQIRVILPGGTHRDYRGTLTTMRWGTGARVINRTTFELYLRSVVPLEMPASWPAAALQAQAVAARSYAAWNKANPSSTHYDTCDTSSCQVYRGIADYSWSGSLVRRWEDSRTDAAVSRTAGMVLRYAGAPAMTQFSSSNGGRTVSGGQPYLPAKIDPYDGVVSSSSNPHRWTTSVAISKVEAAYPATGALRSIAIGGRSGGGDWSGRTTSVTITGSAGSVTVSSDAFRTKLGLRSTWWTITSRPPRSTATFPRDLSADGLADALVPNGGALTLLRYGGAMSFSTHTMASSGWAGLRLIAGVGPLDQDNLADVVAGTSDGSLYLYPGNASGTLDRGRVRLGGGWLSVNLIIPSGDFDGDGYTDFIARRTDGVLVLYRGTGTGSLAASTVIGSGWGSFSSIFVGDFDGNGTRDIAGIVGRTGQMRFYSGTGKGGALLGVNMAGSTNWRFASAVRGVGDLTGDGRDDIVVRRASDGALLVYPVVGTITVGTPIRAGTYAATHAWAQ